MSNAAKRVWARSSGEVWISVLGSSSVSSAVETPGNNVIKLFSLLQKTRPNKQECLYLAITFQSSLTFAGNIRSLPKNLKCPQVGFALALPSNSKTQLESIFNGKPFSLLGLVISDEEKKFYNIDTWGQCYKTFYGRKL